MKKLLLLLVVSLMAAGVASAQTFKNGYKLVTLGIGFGGAYGRSISASYEAGVYDINSEMSIGVGGILAYGNRNRVFVGGNISNKLSIGEKTSNKLFGIQGVFHWTKFTNFDLTVSFNIGYDFSSTKFKPDPVFGPAPSVLTMDVFFALNIGAKYYFTERLGTFINLGFGISFAQIGLAYKF